MTEIIKCSLLSLGILVGVLIPTQVKSHHPTQTIAQLQEGLTVVQSYDAVVSWYRHGTITANGEQYNPNGSTVAHKTLPFNTLVRFTNPLNGVSIVVRVNDRGPFIRGRDFDLSLGSARRLGIVEIGVTRLRVEILG